jgi:hypothetical protein
MKKQPLESRTLGFPGWKGPRRASIPEIPVTGRKLSPGLLVFQEGKG